MRAYWKPRDPKKRAHFLTDRGEIFCKNKALMPLDYAMYWGEIPDDQVCGNCKSVEHFGNPENFYLERGDVQCRNCGQQNVGGDALEFGFYCMKCGEFWRFKSRLNPLPPFREEQQGLLPWE